MSRQEALTDSRYYHNTECASQLKSMDRYPDPGGAQPNA